MGTHVAHRHHYTHPSLPHEYKDMHIHIHTNTEEREDTERQRERNRKRERRRRGRGREREREEIERGEKGIGRACSHNPPHKSILCVEQILKHVWW